MMICFRWVCRLDKEVVKDRMMLILLVVVILNLVLWGMLLIFDLRLIMVLCRVWLLILMMWCYEIEWGLMLSLLFWCRWLLIMVVSRLWVVLMVWKLLVRCKLSFFIGSIWEYLVLVVLFLILKVGFIDGWCRVSMLCLLIFFRFWVRLIVVVVLFLLRGVGVMVVMMMYLL